MPVIPMWWLPVIVLVLVVAAARMAVWCCDPANASAADLWFSPARRRARREQELRDIDAWLTQIRSLPPVVRREADPPFPDPNWAYNTCCGKCVGGTCYVDQMTGA